MDPVTISAGAAIQVVKFAWSGAVAGRKLIRASKAIGNVVVDSLAIALCPTEPDDREVRRTAVLIATKLQELPLERKVGSAPSRAQQARSYLHSRIRPKQVPQISQFAKKRFEDRLREWLEEAFANEEIGAQAAAVSCRQGGVEEIARAFPDCFISTLEEADESEWRDELLRALKEQDEGHEFLEKRRKRERERRSFTIGLTTAATGAATGAAGGAIAGGSAESIVFASLVGLAVGAIGGVTGQRTQWAKGLTQAQIAAREGVRAWISDLAKTIKPPRTDSAGEKTEAEWSQWLSTADAPVVATLDDGLLEDLSGRLKLNAQQAGDDELLANLIALETAVVRYQRGSDDRQAVIEALKSTIAVAQLGPSS